MGHIINTYKRFPLSIDYGEDVYLFDTNGKKYLDFVAGIATNCLGYSNEGYKQAMKNQIDRLLHCSNLYSSDINEACAEILVAQTELDEVMFVNSGTEATEAALKLARICSKNLYGKEKFEIISMQNSFHGRTMGALALTAQPKYQEDFTPLMSGVRYAEFNDIDSLRGVITENTCALIIEIIQGEGGIVTADYDYIQALRKFCDEKKLLLIIDEVQSGVGRTGKFYAYQHYNIKPDIVISAKGLGGGFPCGCILATQAVAQHFTAGKHGSTFGGNPLASTAVYTIVDTIVKDDLLSHVEIVSKYLIEALHTLKDNYQIIKEIRGLGLMLGIELKEEVLSSDVVAACMDKGLLLVGAGKNTVRFVPPLVIQQAHVDEAISILDAVLSQF